MALKHKALGAVGVINGGSIRDLPGIAAAEMPVWATGRVPGHGPFNLIETNTEVEVGDLIIKPGDLIGAVFMKEFKDLLEKPSRLLLWVQRLSL